MKAAKAIGLTIEEALNDDRKTSLLAGKVLRKMGWTRKYNHAAWDRGMRWLSPEGQVYNASNATVLSYAINK